MLLLLCGRSIDESVCRRRLPLRHAPAGVLGPGVETLARARLYPDRHEGMIATAQLVTVAVVGSFPLDPRPGLVQPAWNRILFDAERLDAPGMHHVRGGDLNAYDRLDRKNDVLVDRQKAQRALLRRQLVFGNARARELDPAIVGVGIAPEPLIAGDLQREVRRQGEIDLGPQPERPYGG